MINSDYIKLEMLNSVESMLVALSRYDSEHYKPAMHSALTALSECIEAVEAFSNDFPYDEKVWDELHKIEEVVNRLKWDYVE